MKINSNEAVRLFVILIISKIFFWDITKFVYNSGTAGWIESLVVTLIVLLLFFVAHLFYKKTDYKDVFDTTKDVFGKTGLIIFGTFLTVIQIMNFVIVLKSYATTITTVTLTSSSTFYVSMFVVATLIASGYLGLKNIVKLASVSFVVIISFIAILVIFDIQNFELKNIFPIFGNGVKGFLLSYKNIGFFNELIFLFFLVPLLKNKKDIGKIGIYSISVSGAIITLMTLVFTFIIPYPVNMRYYLPVFEITSSVNFFVIFQRAEAIYLILWLFTCFLYTGATFCFLIYTIKKTFSLSDSKAIIPALLMIIITLTGIYENINAMEPAHNVLTYAFSIAFFVVMTAIFAISSHRRKKTE